MAIKEILAKIKTVLGADAPAETISLLAEADREANDILESLSAANKESAGRKSKIRELESELNEAKTKAESVNDPKAQEELKRLKDIETQFQQLQTEAEKKIRNQWADKSKVLSVDKSSKIFDKIEKVKGKFVFPEANSDLPIDVVKRNLETYELLESTGYFAGESLPAGGAAPGTNTQNVPDSASARILALSKQPITERK